MADIAPAGLLGTAYGWFNLTTGLMLLPSSVLFGWLWEAFGPQAAFTFGAGCALSAAWLLRDWVGIGRAARWQTMAPADPAAEAASIGNTRYEGRDS